MGIRAQGNPTIKYASVWAETGTGAMDPPPKDYGAVARYGDRAIVVAGYDSADVNTIQYFNTTSTGNASDFGDYLITTRGCRSLSGNGAASRGLTAGGYSDYDASNKNQIGYVTIPTPGNAIDFGDLTAAGQWASSMTSGTRGVWASRPESDDICYITIATTGDATDFGDMTAAGGACAGCSSETRGMIMGGNRVQGNRIEYITIASTGNATDFGDLTEYVRWCSAASSSAGRAVRIGGKDNNSGNVTNVMDYVAIATPGNATDFGDLTTTMEPSGCCSNGTRGLVPGRTGSNQIEYITIGTPGNAIDFGDLTHNTGSAGSTTGTPS